MRTIPFPSQSRRWRALALVLCCLILTGGSAAVVWNMRDTMTPAAARELLQRGGSERDLRAAIVVLLRDAELTLAVLEQQAVMHDGIGEQARLALQHLRK